MTKSTKAYGVLAAVFLLVAFPTSGKTSEAVSFKSGAILNETPQGTDVRGVYFVPEGSGPFAAVILLPHCGGYTSSNVRQGWPDYLTKLGYAVLTVDTFGPQGRSTCVGLDKGKSRPEQARYAYGALDYLAARPDVDGKRIAVMGFSEGAFAINKVIVPSRSRKQGGINFKAAVSLYGGCWGLAQYSKKDIPLMLIVPEHDDKLAPNCISIGDRDPYIEMHVLKGAYHGFDGPELRKMKYDDAGNRMFYSRSATVKAHKLAKAFFDIHIGSLAGTGVKRDVAMGTDEARIALEDWLASNKQLCSKDEDYFTNSVKDHIGKLISDKKIIKSFMVSSFYLRRLYKKNCS